MSVSNLLLDRNNIIEVIRVQLKLQSALSYVHRDPRGIGEPEGQDIYAKNSIGLLVGISQLPATIIKWRTTRAAEGFVGYRTTSRYKPINKMIRSRCNDVSNKIRGKLQTTPSQFSRSSPFNLILPRRWPVSPSRQPPSSLVHWRQPVRAERHDNPSFDSLGWLETRYQTVMKSLSSTRFLLEMFIPKPVLCIMHRHTDVARLERYRRLCVTDKATFAK